MKNTEWLPVNGYEGKYEISINGTVRALFKNGLKRELKGQDLGGYRRVKLRANGAVKNFLVHRIVAKAFIPRIVGKEFVNHKDGNKSNNKPENLEWCTSKENAIHAHATRLVGSKLGRSYKRRQSSSLFKGVRLRGGKYQVVFQFNHKKIYGGTFLSETEASTKYNELYMKLKRELDGQRI